MIRPLHNWVCVRRLEYKHDLLEVIGIKLEKGEVLAVGPGKERRRKVRFDKMPGMSSGALYFEDGEYLDAPRHPILVKKGDFVEFSPRNQVEFYHAGERLLMIRADAIYGKSSKSQNHALLWQQSAGYDRHGNYMPGTVNEVL